MSVCVWTLRVYFCDCMNISHYVFPFNQVNDEELISIFSDVQYNVTNNDMSSDVALQENDAGEMGFSMILIQMIIFLYLIILLWI